LQTNQSASEAGKPGWPLRAGRRAEVLPATTDSDEICGALRLSPLARPDFLDLIGSMGKKTESQVPEAICVFIGLEFVVIIGLVYTWLCSCKKGLAVAVPAGA